MPIDTELDWAGVHSMAIEDYVTERDPEAANNLCVVLDPGIHGGRVGVSQSRIGPASCCWYSKSEFL